MKFSPIKRMISIIFILGDFKTDLMKIIEFIFILFFIITNTSFSL